MLSIANLNALKAYFGCFTSCEKHHIGQNEKTCSRWFYIARKEKIRKPLQLSLGGNGEILFAEGQLV